MRNARSGSCITDRIALYSNLILAAENDRDFDPLWRRFYRIQMAFFIMDRVLDGAGLPGLAGGLEAYRKILCSWNDLKEYLLTARIPVRDMDNLFKTVHIDFRPPCMALIPYTPFPLSAGNKNPAKSV